MAEPYVMPVLPPAGVGWLSLNEDAQSSRATISFMLDYVHLVDPRQIIISRD